MLFAHCRGLAQLMLTLPAPHPLLVGFSGGLDSTVLLHLLASDAAARRQGLRAIHVHHGLHPEADRWAAHCQRMCDALAVPMTLARVQVDNHSGLGLEAAARAARHTAFADAMAADDMLVLAHHQDDQAETFLLRALRGSGVDGLAAMRDWRAFCLLYTSAPHSQSPPPRHSGPAGVLGDALALPQCWLHHARAGPHR